MKKAKKIPVKEAPRNLSKTAEKSAKYRNSKGPAKYFAPYRLRKKIKEDLEIDSSEITKSKGELNPDIWDDQAMINEQVRKACLKIAKKFEQFIGSNVKVLDVILTGSMANYNWHDKSDIDIHLVVDFNSIDFNEDLVSDFLYMKKALWNLKYNVKIKGYNVEVYCDKSRNESPWRAVYSLKKNRWISKPKKRNPQIDIESIKKKAYDIIALIDHVETIADNESKEKKIEKVFEKIRSMRKLGLESDGEYAPENLAFKFLRNAGYLEKLSDLRTSSTNKLLSLQESKNMLFESNNNEAYDFACLMVKLDFSNWGSLKEHFDEEDFCEDEKGFEEYPHVTVLYGIHSDGVNPKQMKKFVDKFNRDKIIVELEEVTLFENEKFDVVKFDINDIHGDLHKINKAIRDNFDYTSNFPDYHPHVTIAYVKPGLGKKYVEKFKDLKYILAESKKIVYSEPSGQKYFWKLKDQTNVLEVDDDIKDMNDDKVDIIKDFICFCQDKLDIKGRVYVGLRNGRDEYIATTAAYSPSEDKNYIRCGGRSLVDILRSIAHELVHNAQREHGLFKVGDDIPDVGGKIEDMANSIAGIIIKDFTKNYGYDFVYDE